jgi:hypothetical protein
MTYPFEYNCCVFQHSETNMMHLLFSLLRIKGLYMFRALLSHSQEGLHKRHLVYDVRVMSVSCARIRVELMHGQQNNHVEFFPV